MNLYKTNIGAFDISELNLFKKYIEKIIDEYINDNSKTRINQRLHLVFASHEEIYNINDPQIILNSETDNPFQLLADDIKDGELLSIAYLRNQIKNGEYGVLCNLSSKTLETCIIGFRKKYSDSSIFNINPYGKGRFGEPFLLTNCLIYNKNDEFFQYIVNNIGKYLGIFQLEDFPEFEMCSKGDIYEGYLNPTSIRKLFNVTVTNDYFFTVLRDGKIIISTPVSSVVDAENMDFTEECKLNKNNQIVDIKTDKIYENDLLAAYLIDETLINYLLFYNNPNFVFLRMQGFYCDTVKQYIAILEDYCNDMCVSYPRN